MPKDGLRNLQELQMNGIRLKKNTMLQIAAVVASVAIGGCQTTYQQTPSAVHANVEEDASAQEGHGLFRSPTAKLEAFGLRNQEVIAPVPKELVKVCLPDYRVESPDILLIEAVRAIPKPPYKAEPLDVLFINLVTPFKDQPLVGTSAVETDGTINLGATYGGSVS